MTNALIDDVRRNANAQASDVTDADIQRELERARCLVRAELCWHPTQTGAGTLEYRQAHVRPWGEFSPGTAGQTNGGTLAVGTIRDSLGGVLGGWSISRDGWIDFATPGSFGSAYYLAAWGYDVNRATASILEEMAARQLLQYDVTLGGDSQSRSQKAQNLQAAAKMYRKRALVVDVPTKRSDESW